MTTDGDAAPLTMDELTDRLAEATDTDPEEIDRQADQLWIESPHTADVVTDE